MLFAYSIVIVVTAALVMIAVPFIYKLTVVLLLHGNLRMGTSIAAARRRREERRSLSSLAASCRCWRCPEPRSHSPDWNHVKEDIIYPSIHMKILRRALNTHQCPVDSQRVDGQKHGHHDEIQGNSKEIHYHRPLSVWQILGPQRSCNIGQESM